MNDKLTQLYEYAVWADKAFHDALVEDFGSDAGDMRYAKVLPTRHARLRTVKIEADTAWLAAIHNGITNKAQLANHLAGAHGTIYPTRPQLMRLSREELDAIHAGYHESTGSK